MSVKLNTYGEEKIEILKKKSHIVLYIRNGDIFINKQEYPKNCWEFIHLDQAFIVKVS